MEVPRKRELFQELKNSIISIVPAFFIGIVSCCYFVILSGRYLGVDAPDLIKIPVILAQPLRSFNGYGLFSIMTVSRPEIVVEGSNDGGAHWLAYEFRFKPGDVKRAPPIVAPHQPRLDWQMWFAALGPKEQSPWFDFFVKRLLQGSPDVLALLDKNPFPDKPPKLIRAVIFDYHFTFWSRLQYGHWWKRKYVGIFYPPKSLEDFKEKPLNPSALLD